MICSVVSTPEARARRLITVEEDNKKLNFKYALLKGKVELQMPPKRRQESYYLYPGHGELHGEHMIQC